MLCTFTYLIIFGFLFQIKSSHQQCVGNTYNDKQQMETSTCLVWSDYNLKTFDDHGLSFRSDCPITLVYFELDSGVFKIDVGKGNKVCTGDECYTFVDISYNGETYHLGRDHNDLNLPTFTTGKNSYFLSADIPEISVTKSGIRGIVDFNEIGVTIKWDEKNMIEISIENDKGYKTLGLCGNNDQCSSNDQLSRTGETILDVNKFVKEWRVSSTCTGVIDAQFPCKESAVDIKNAETACKILKKAPFEDANDVLNPQLYIDACVWNYCDCAAKNIECLCETLDVYAKASVSAGLPEISWRDSTGCVPPPIITTTTAAPLPQCLYVCPTGYEIKNMTCVDINECLRFNPCGQLAECYNKQPGFECGFCPAGYKTNHTKYFNAFHSEINTEDLCLDVNECEENTFDCPDTAICWNTEGSYKCIECDANRVPSSSGKCVCAAGWTGDGQKCFDIDECTANTNTCPNDMMCINTEGSYKCIKCDPNARFRSINQKCVCNIGWAGDGTVCGTDTDMDGWPDYQLGCSGEKCKKDNCQTKPNSGQQDIDNNGVGDACDADYDKDGILNNKDNCPLTSNVNQQNRDGDVIGDVCDNCPDIFNNDQDDIDNDQIGDACDSDADGDGVQNTADNCPYKRNEDQSDKDGDGKGDVCDNCPLHYNPGQEDEDLDFIGDICDSGTDADKDGIKDNIDNCRDIPNSDQSDLDKDGEGDACDDDIDNDGIPNIKDNCIMVYNPDQKVSNNNGRGDVCEKDIDGDGVIDEIDNCPKNNLVSKTDFRSFEQIAIYRPKDAYRIKSNGTEILRIGYGESANIILSSDRFDNVDYEGTIFVDADTPGYVVGFVFGYQSRSKFYAVTWRGKTFDTGHPVYIEGVAIILISSHKGLYGNVLYYGNEAPNLSKVVYRDPNKYVWLPFTSYRWKLIHRPTLGLINLKIWSGVNVVVDTGYIFDTTIAGGKLGVYDYYEPHVIWSNLEYRCDDYDPRTTNGIPEAV